jgi:four helix bundle protein
LGWRAGGEMSKVERFEDLHAWQGAREAASSVYRATSVGAFSRDYALRDQIRRAVISVPSNIAEGFSRRSNKEFAHFLFIAKGSIAEVQSQLYLALDQGYISQEGFGESYDKLETTAR